MNCANHADASAVAYCRTCGKALCANCTRPVRGVIYCEDCLGSKMEGVPSGTAGFFSGGFSATTFPPAAPGQIPPILPPPPGISSGPNPTVAGILAGFFPFGVGAVYTGQYAKGLAHLVVFGFLWAGANAAGNHGGGALEVICILGLVFFWIYQVMDAVRSAKAIQLAQPIPDPFGLAATFGGGGGKIETSKIPLGAIVLIGLGVLFLLNTMGLELGLDRFWPIILIALGGWMFARNWGLAGELTGKRARLAAKYPGYAAMIACQCTRCRARRMMGPAVLATLGFLFLFETLGRISFWHTSWPVLLLVIGGVKLFQSTASAEGHIPFPAVGTSPPGGPIPPMPPMPPVPPDPPVPPTSEVNHG